ncbi:hypothetical protein GYMLUDRAFT_735396 [Collybiopsis luxurians FD-317 M1]|nr:hypothetical protein GYMLUDRAFT_735396 [Collybiopsis luxurians FD-317 M1]
MLFQGTSRKELTTLNLAKRVRNFLIILGEDNRYDRSELRQLIRAMIHEFGYLWRRWQPTENMDFDSEETQWIFENFEGENYRKEVLANNNKRKRYGPEDKENTLQSPPKKPRTDVEISSFIARRPRLTRSRSERIRKVV